MSRACRIALAVALLLTLPAVRADPWLAPGDEGLRSDIAWLTDAGILNGPITTWPISWPDVARDALAADATAYDGATAEALVRVQRRARAAARMGLTGTRLQAAAAHAPPLVRDFAATPREEGELSLGASWLGERFAWNLQGTVVAEPQDGKRFRPDGSYLGATFGNFMVSAGYMERWWGPGWDGSLILSTNARPIPSLTLERNYTDPFEVPWLRWIGRWRASIAVGRAETHGVAVGGVRFLAARVAFKPRNWLELGLTRTAQWCGGDRECGLGTFGDMLVGRDNQDESLAADDEPGNQMAGYDLRLRSPWRRLPVVVYTQWIGEDEAGNLPSRFLGQFGLESWFDTGWGGLRVRAEYSDTTCAFMRSDPDFNCAYRHTIYPQGYTYRGRFIGHSIDNDSRVLGVGGILRTRDGDTFSATLRRIDVNRDGGDHVISAVPVRYVNVELRYSRAFGFGTIQIGAGFDDQRVSVAQEKTRAFVMFQRGY